jgi:hypothetical protein
VLTHARVHASKMNNNEEWWSELKNQDPEDDGDGIPLPPTMLYRLQSLRLLHFVLIEGLELTNKRYKKRVYDISRKFVIFEAADGKQELTPASSPGLKVILTMPEVFFNFKIKVISPTFYFLLTVHSL